jgi:hypothetical protein
VLRAYEPVSVVPGEGCKDAAGKAGLRMMCGYDTLGMRPRMRECPSRVRLGASRRACTSPETFSGKEHAKSKNKEGKIITYYYCCALVVDEAIP